MIQAYAIADHPGPPLPDAASGVRSVPAGRLEALCADVAQSDVSPEALWRHEEVVEALMESRDLLPVRYGTRLPDEAGVVSAVAERHDALLAALNRVRGAVELSLRIAAPPQSEVSREAAERLHAQLVPLARDATLLNPRDSPDLLRGAYLVDRRAMMPFTEAVARLQQAHPELRLLCTGPWPPYSFAQP